MTILHSLLFALGFLTVCLVWAIVRGRPYQIGVILLAWVLVLTVVVIKASDALQQLP